ncbi:hypothetical protein ABBQ32_000766 [Trebouxia sp. C0010 RCD-2024]
MASSAYGLTSCSSCWSSKEAGRKRIAVSPRTVAGQCVPKGSPLKLSNLTHALVARAFDKPSPHLVSSEECDDGSIMFCFGNEAEAKSAAALAATAATEQDKDTSSVEQQAVQAASQGSQEQVQPRKAEAHLTTQKSSPKQNLAGSGTDSLPQPASAPAASEQIKASEAELAAASKAGTSSSSADTLDGEASGSERVPYVTPQQLEGLKVAELKDLCRQEQMQGYSKLKKDELISKLQDADNQVTTVHSSSEQDLANSSAQSPQQPTPVPPQQITASEAEQVATSDLERAELDGTFSSADTSDEEASGSDSAGERLWDMTPEQLEGLKVAELKDLCRQEHMKGYSKLKKDELISKLQQQLQDEQQAA